MQASNFQSQIPNSNIKIPTSNPTLNQNPITNPYHRIQIPNPNHNQHNQHPPPLKVLSKISVLDLSLQIPIPNSQSKSQSQIPNPTCNSYNNQSLSPIQILQSQISKFQYPNSNPNLIDNINQFNLAVT